MLVRFNVADVAYESALEALNYPDLTKRQIGLLLKIVHVGGQVDNSGDYQQLQCAMREFDEDREFERLISTIR